MEHKLNKIMTAVIEKINEPTIKTARDLAVESISISHPIVGAISTGATSFLSEMDAFMLDQLLKGLSSGLNQEKQINDLYNYVISSKSRAFLVGTIFKQTLASKSPKTCVLYGKILANHIGENSADYTRDEMIVCNALVNANDYDLMGFVTLMRECVLKEDDGTRKITFNKSNEKIMEIQSELITTCTWCTYNRLFSFNPVEWGTFVNETLIFDTRYRVEPPSDILLKCIEEVKQIREYGNYTT